MVGILDTVSRLEREFCPPDLLRTGRQTVLISRRVQDVSACVQDEAVCGPLRDAMENCLHSRRLCPFIPIDTPAESRNDYNGSIIHEKPTIKCPLRNKKSVRVLWSAYHEPNAHGPVISDSLPFISPEPPTTDISRTCHSIRSSLTPASQIAIMNPPHYIVASSLPPHPYSISQPQNPDSTPPNCSSDRTLFEIHWMVRVLPMLSFVMHVTALRQQGNRYQP